MTDPKRKTAEGVRERILDAAVELLRVKGFKQLTQPRVAAAAGVPQGHLTYYFPRRTDLLTAVARRSVELLANDLASFLAGEGWPGADASERARVLALTGFHVKNRERTRMLLGLLVEAEEDAELRETLKKDVNDVRTIVAHGLGEGVTDTDVDVHMATLWGLSIRHLLFSPAGNEALTEEGEREDERTDSMLNRLQDWTCAVREQNSRKSGIHTRRKKTS